MGKYQALSSHKVELSIAHCGRLNVRYAPIVISGMEFILNNYLTILTADRYSDYYVIVLIAMICFN